MDKKAFNGRPPTCSCGAPNPCSADGAHHPSGADWSSLDTKADAVLVRLEDAISNIDYPGTDAAEWEHKAKAAAADLRALVVTTRNLIQALNALGRISQMPDRPEVVAIEDPEKRHAYLRGYRAAVAWARSEAEVGIPGARTGENT